MPFSSGNDIWGNDNWSATAAHYCAQKSWDYFKQTPLNRNGMTGWGKHLRIVADYKDRFNNFINNAYYDPTGNEDYLVISRFNNNYLATYDILGHEFTHGVTNRSRPLPYEKISGALNESYSDIFGYMIERYAMGGHQNWTIGEHANTTLRDMQNPNSFSHPRFFLQSSYWVSMTGCVPSNANDNCGVHTNSGVQNKWFQLLTTGGTNNVNGNNRSVGGIGADKAARIAYYTLVNYKNYDPQNSNFNVVRANSIASAAILYGMCSNEYNNTCAAWHAVNVGNYCDPCALAWRNSRFQNGLTGMTNKSKNVFNVSLYPNPTNNKITLLVEESAINDNNHYQISIYDIQGKLLQSLTTSNVNNYEIDVQRLSVGIYNVNISTGNWTKNIKFIKE
jgi:Zn-dependent metalloprotease